MSDYYKILGVPEDATLEQIKRAYRRKAKMLHPDVYKEEGAKYAFQQINEAYHVLINKDKRIYYDLKQKYNHAQYRKYGRNYENRFNKNDFQSPYKTGGAYDNYNFKNEGVNLKPKTLKLIDNFFFYFMLLVGIMAIIFGTIDLFFRKWEGPNNLTGFIFGITYTTLLVVGWYLRSKTDKKHMKTDFI